MASSSPTLRLCHLADIHLGYRRYHRVNRRGANIREQDVSRAFQEAVSQVIALKPDITIIAGDLFHTVRPSNAIVTFAFRELRRLVEGTGAAVVLIAGNHDSPRRLDTGCLLRLFDQIDGVYVADLAEQTFVFPDLDLSVTAIPHLALEHLLTQTGSGRASISLRADESYRFNALVLHGQLRHQWVSDFGGAQFDLDSLGAHEWDYIALGHIHRYQNIAYNAAYSGSLEHTSSNIWADREIQKGFLEVVLPERDMRFHPLSSPREVLTLRSVSLEDVDVKTANALIFDALEEVPGGLEGKIVQLPLTSVSHATFRHLDHGKLREFKAKALHLSLDISFAEYRRDQSHLQAERGETMMEQLESFVDERSGDARKRDRLLDTLREVSVKEERTRETS